MNTLKKVRQHWEKDLTPLSLIENQRRGEVLVILETTNSFDADKYHCHRYWDTLDGDWVCSVDQRYSNVQDVFSWITTHTSAAPCLAL